MLNNTFCHIPGIGLRSELRLWERGARTWDDVFELALPFRGAKRRAFEDHLYQSQEALREFDGRFFLDTIPESEDWRLFPEFRTRVAYLDIETTGLGPTFGDHITTIALYNGNVVKYYIHGENLQEFRDDIYNYDLLVTYNGKCFDIPFIENYFLITLPQAHIDLRFLLANLGYKGGLKGVERAFGLDRGELDGVDGYFAVLLWQEWIHKGTRSALETLLAYNIQDTTSLEKLMIHAYNLKIAETPFADSHTIALPTVEPVLPFEVDMAMIDKIRRRIGRRW